MQQSISSSVVRESRAPSTSSILEKTGRVKVGVRCRPPFPDEIELAGQGNFFSIVQCIADNPKTTGSASLARVSLTMMNGKQRDFLYDYAFDSESNQDNVYDKVARPVVTDVIRGFNGTIFAYGQTGTGKTYTMGILDFVKNKHAGIIPRSLSQIFDWVTTNRQRVTSTVTMSFLQLYRDTIHDLLCPPSSAMPHGEDILHVREDPARGFYVDGLKEYIVQNYSQAEALVNLGLENRAIAPTLMNNTSSRSHTILTINIEQRGDVSLDADDESASIENVDALGRRGLGGSAGYGSFTKTTRSKLLMVDLAGSERVRRTLSKGTRLSEAKSINSSLSALGNVIAALADPNAPHIPYRVSKLTRLLQDSLGGTASTAMIATIGPAAVNYNETLSTLQFASRCMAVKSKPVIHEEINYAELCAVLQMKLSNMEGHMADKLLKQQLMHESVVRELTAGGATMPAKSYAGAMANEKQFSALRLAALDKILAQLSAIREGKAPEPPGKSWLSIEKQKQAGEIFSLFAYSYELLRAVTEEVATILKENISRDEADRESVLVQLSTELEMEKIRDVERMNMEANDPVISKFRSQDGFEGLKSHLIPISRVDVFKKISNDHGSNNVPTNPSDNGFEIFSFHAGEAHLTDFDTPESLAAAISDAHDGIYKNLRSIAILMARKDAHYSALRDELATEIIERKKREEEVWKRKQYFAVTLSLIFILLQVVNWSYILKYLLGTISKLREKLSVEADVAGGGVRLLASLVNSTDASLPEKIHGSPQSLASVKFNEDGDYAGQSKVQKASSDFMNIPQYMPSDENRVRVTVGSGVSGIGSGKDNRDIKRFTSNAVDPRRRIVSDNPSGTSSRKSAFRNNIEPSPLERVSLRKDSADSKVGVRGFMFADVDQLGPPSDDSAHGNTTEYDDDERGGGANSPIGHYNNYEEASDAYRSDTFKSEITYSSYRDFPAKSKIMPSRFAQSVAQDLGVIGQDANATMSVIDQLALITDAEINAMDPGL